MTIRRVPRIDVSGRASNTLVLPSDAPAIHKGCMVVGQVPTPWFDVGPQVQDA